MIFFEISDVVFLKYLLHIFNIFGLTTLSVTTKEKEKITGNEAYFLNSRYALLYNFILLIVITIINLWTSEHLYVVRYKRVLNLFFIVDIFEQLLGTIVVMVILIFYCANKETSLELISKIYKLKLITDKLNFQSKRATFFYILFFISFFIIISVIIFVSGIIYFQTHLYLISGITRNLTIVLFLFQYASVAISLSFILKNINETLLKMMESLPTVKQIKKNNVFVSVKKLQLLSTIRDLHFSVLEICQKVNNFYGIPILLGIGYMFICSVTYSYFLVHLVIVRKPFFNIIEYVHNFLTFTSFMCSFIALSKSINKIMQEVYIILINFYEYYLKDLFNFKFHLF